MAIPRTSVGRDLFIKVRTGRGCRAALEQAMRDAIRRGLLKPGTVLPSTRVLANDLGVARSTISEAYAQLSAAGYIATRHGASTRVAYDAAHVGFDQAERNPAPAPRFDLRPGVPDVACFPRVLWLRAFRRALAQARPDVFTYGDSRGRPELRTALAEYLARTRGVVTMPARLLICNGFQQGLKLVCDVLRARGAHRIGIEDPSLWRFPIIARAAGLQCVPIPVDLQGLQTDLLDELKLDAVLVTPAHQFPLGVMMSSQRRTELLGWARRRDAFVIEDDYDGEFRYDRRPTGALQGLDPDRVVYGGTTAKTLAPGIRLGWVALPLALLDPAIEIRSVADRYTGVFDQIALGQLIESGDLDRHVRAMRHEYRNRREALVSAVLHATPGLTIRGEEAGLHAVLELPGELTERELLSIADRRSIGLHGLACYRHGTYSGPEALIVGVGGPASHQFMACVQALASMLNQAWPRPGAR